MSFSHLGPQAERVLKVLEEREHRCAATAAVVHRIENGEHPLDVLLETFVEMSETRERTIDRLIELESKR